MKKTSLLNAPISSLIARLGHGDMICIADAGLPVPAGVECIDLAVSRGVPGLVQTVAAVCSELQVEAVMMASELSAEKGPLRDQLLGALDAIKQEQDSDIDRMFMPHAEFKGKTGQCRAVIRTGECTAYANIILVSGVTF